MKTILNILLGFFILMFSGVAITLVGGWLVLQLFGDKEKDDCGCNSCDCDDDLIPMLDRPLTKKELKEVNMKPKINDFNKKTKVSGMGGRGGPIDAIRGKKQTPTNEPREENDPNPTQK
jgi:hypothetical protein